MFPFVSFEIDLTQQLTANGEWVEIADLNIVRQSDMAAFTKASKARTGKIKGIVDPIFGMLDGYGAWFQNLYATKNVNIAGTLTAGDENGFSSTFYVGKIHKNVIRNSIDCRFEEETTTKIEEKPPVGIGNVWQTGPSAKWKRCHVSFFLRESLHPQLCIELRTSAGGIKITAPQLEAGTTPSQYQPTDGRLSFVEDYGAWFAKGGIGGNG